MLRTLTHFPLLYSLSVRRSFSRATALVHNRIPHNAASPSRWPFPFFGGVLPREHHETHISQALAHGPIIASRAHFEVCFSVGIFKAPSLETIFINEKSAGAAGPARFAFFGDISTDTDIDIDL